MIKNFSEFVNDTLKEGYLRRIISSEIKNEDRIEDSVKREEKIGKIKSWLYEKRINNYTIDEKTLEIDVDGNVKLFGIDSGKLPNYIKFREVKGDFDCSFTDLISLEGCPKVVKGEFDCSYNNRLTSLKYCPTEIGSNFKCAHNQLDSLECCPTEIKGYFDCSDNQLTSLEHCPTKIKGSFDCSINKITSLEGFPDFVGGSFNCSHNELTSLKGCKTEIEGSFNCSHNQLTSLEHCPEVVEGDFKCTHNENLTSLEHCPKKVGYFLCSCVNLEDFDFKTGHKEKVKVMDDFFVDMKNDNNEYMVEYKKRNDIKKYFEINKYSDIDRAIHFRGSTIYRGDF